MNGFYELREVSNKVREINEEVYDVWHLRHGTMSRKSAKCDNLAEASSSSRVCQIFRRDCLAEGIENMKNCRVKMSGSSSRRRYETTQAMIG